VQKGEWAAGGQYIGFPSGDMRQLREARSNKKPGVRARGAALRPGAFSCTGCCRGIGARVGDGGRAGRC